MFWPPFTRVLWVLLVVVLIDPGHSGLTFFRCSVRAELDNPLNQPFPPRFCQLTSHTCSHSQSIPINQFPAHIIRGFIV